MSLIDDLSQRGDELRAQVRQMLKRHQYSTTTKSVMLLAYVDLALEHHAAIWLLRERELFGSAFALVRPLYEIVFRALWIGAKATDDRLSKRVGMIWTGRASHCSTTLNKPTSVIAHAKTRS
jgi:hypothetical protein